MDYVIVESSLIGLLSQPKIFNIILSHIKDMHLMHYLELTEYSSALLYGRLSVVTAGTD